MSESYCLMLTTAGNRDEADRLADLLVSRRLAACVQITGIVSTYTWEGKVTRDSEYLLLIKTRASLYQEAESAIVENHSYKVPEVIQLPVARGLASYLQWITDSTQ